IKLDTKTNLLFINSGLSPLEICLVTMHQMHSPTTSVNGFEDIFRYFVRLGLADYKAECDFETLVLNNPDFSELLGLDRLGAKFTGKQEFYNTFCPRYPHYHDLSLFVQMLVEKFGQEILEQKDEDQLIDTLKQKLGLTRLEAIEKFLELRILTYDFKNTAFQPYMAYELLRPLQMVLDNQLCGKKADLYHYILRSYFRLVNNPDYAPDPFRTPSPLRSWLKRGITARLYNRQYIPWYYNYSLEAIDKMDFVEGKLLRK
ncbi:MAG: hypothetical protein PHV30_08955, partial [Candidatus Margulisbacteria bacterium]|nr:hypothetical protein [Candidatus Margulisiibacteriota bacterium]